jgi:16S rRNA (cytosine1402-N4)-methyltransferase
VTAHEIPPDPDQSTHVPVLVEEVMVGLRIRPGSVSIDCTLGGGGHTNYLLDLSAPDGRVLGLDADPAALRRVGLRFGQAVQEGRLVMAQAFFRDVAQVAGENRFQQVDAILFDLGVSSFQLETPERGFSLMRGGPLDMRFDPQQDESAAEIVNEWEEAEIADIIYRYGEERRSRRIARAIVHHRPIASTEHLAHVIERAMGGRKGSRIHPATRTFQALRIAVNAELAQLEQALPQCLDLLGPGGRLAIISFHSLEDRIVKRWMAGEASDFVRDPMHPFGGYERTPTLQLVTRRPLTATSEEIISNPRSRSAKLRIAERIGRQRRN